MWVGFFAEVDVVKLGGSLVVKEKAKVAVATCGLGRLDARGELERSDKYVLAQRNAMWAAVRWLVVRFPEQLVDLAVFNRNDFPFFLNVF